jgi:hypothetical protein
MPSDVTDALQQERALSTGYAALHYETFPAEFLNVDFDVKSRIAAGLRVSVF